MKEVVLSGIRATGRLHLGNMLGALQFFIKYQNSGDNQCLYFVADQHSLTTRKTPPELLRSNLLLMVKDWLAAGLDPERSIIYVQSSVPEISELSLYLGMLQPLGELLTIPTYKDKVKALARSVKAGEVVVEEPKEFDPEEEQKEAPTHGLLTYPVLMAADIIGPRATLVPVGSDQEPNVELAMNLVRRFNNEYGQFLTMPRMMASMVKVPGLSGGKMGKSEEADAVNISAPIEEIRKLYRKKGVTDPQRVRQSDPGDPYNRCVSVYPVHELVTPGETDNRAIANACLAAGIGCAECKDLLVDNLAVILEPYQARRRELDDQDDYVREVLHEGGKKARALIQPTVAAVRDKMGINIY